jgi:hypothetical protein
MPATRSRVAIVFCVIAGACVLLGAGASLRAALGLRAAWPREVDTLVLPSPGLLRVLDLGHHEMAADLVAARANVYFGSQIAAHGDQRWLARTLEIAVQLDPKFHRLYLRGAAMLVYSGNDFTVEALLAANRLLDRGSREFPGDWELPFQAGFNLLFELPKLVGEDDPRVFDWRQRGVEALRQATLLDGAPPWLPNLAARMLTKQGGEELAIRHLEQTYEVTNNPETRSEIARRLAGLRGQRRADQLRQEAEAFEEATTGQYPYVPEGFSVVLGPRLAPGVNLDAVLGRNPGRGGSPSSRPTP